MISIIKRVLYSVIKNSQIDYVKKGYYKKNIHGDKNVILCTGAYLENVVCNISGNENSICIQPGARITNTALHFQGSHHQLIIGKNVTIDGAALVFEDSDCKITIGENTTIYNSTHIAAVERGSEIRIGSDCLFSGYVDIRTTDSHSIIDLQTRKRINFAKNVTIGNHVWLGGHATVLKGSTIGNNCVIGMKSLVTKDIPNNCVAAGSPAVVIKENVTWKFER
jgi:acetyltransferase-like isoleucine patch superfamily enzyme